VNISWDRHGSIEVAKTLVEILEQYPTDKLNSGYGEFYEELFSPLRHTALHVLEIGIAQGGSLRAWRDYFTKAEIYGLDKEKDFVDEAREYRIRTFWIDASSWAELSGWVYEREFDVVIDDGSHKGIDVINAFAILWPKIKSKGYYIIEDVASSRPHYSSVCDYFADFVETTILGDGSATAQLIFLPNMIVLQKK
jgi:hypothetical protein